MCYRTLVDFMDSSLECLILDFLDPDSIEPLLNTCRTVKDALYQYFASRCGSDAVVYSIYCTSRAAFEPSLGPIKETVLECIRHGNLYALKTLRPDSELRTAMVDDRYLADYAAGLRGQRAIRMYKTLRDQQRWGFRFEWSTSSTGAAIMNNDRELLNWLLDHKTGGGRCHAPRYILRSVIRTKNVDMYVYLRRFLLLIKPVSAWHFIESAMLDDIPMLNEMAKDVRLPIDTHAFLPLFEGKRDTGADGFHWLVSNQFIHADDFLSVFCINPGVIFDRLVTLYGLRTVLEWSCTYQFEHHAEVHKRMRHVSLRTRRRIMRFLGVKNHHLWRPMEEEKKESV